MSKQDEVYMQSAIKAAMEAESLGEIPIGACLIDANGEILAVCGNRTILQSDPTAHAEILALREAGARIGNYRLSGAVIYSTVEPCAMCAGALVNARIKRLVYGTKDERFGAVETHFNICTADFLNHRIEIVSGVLADECRELMQSFFRRKRAENKLQRIIANPT